MDTSNVIYLFLKIFIDTIFFYSTLKSNFVGFIQCQLQAILPKKGSHFEKKNEKIIKIYVLDIPKYSFIILYSDN
jgi:HJR/Mrr/RecB family endonuclease